MTYPSISPEVGHLRLNVAPFRVLAHVARLTDGREVATAPLASMAATCKIDAARVRGSLRELNALECVRVTLTGQTARVALTERVRGALVAPGVGR